MSLLMLHYNKSRPLIKTIDEEFAVSVVRTTGRIANPFARCAKYQDRGGGMEKCGRVVEGKRKSRLQVTRAC